MHGQNHIKFITQSFDAVQSRLLAALLNKLHINKFYLALTKSPYRFRLYSCGYVNIISEPKFKRRKIATALTLHWAGNEGGLYSKKFAVTRCLSCLVHSRSRSRRAQDDSTQRLSGKVGDGGRLYDVGQPQQSEGHPIMYSQEKFCGSLLRATNL